MAKLRKMLGDIHWDICQDLMHLIETQSHHTLASWAIHYAKENYLLLYLESVKESCLENVIDECEEYLNQQRQLKDIKPLLKAARADAKTLTDPILEALSKAIATACATVQTPTNALGFLFYGAAAITYYEAGLSQTKEEYDQLAYAELKRAYLSLKEIAVEEENPVKIKWNC